MEQNNQTNQQNNQKQCNTWKYFCSYDVFDVYECPYCHSYIDVSSKRFVLPKECPSCKKKIGEGVNDLENNQQQKQIFEEFPTVDCNDCSHYWDNSCDGSSKGSSKPCKTFSATRRVIYPQEIKSLKKAVRELKVHLFVAYGCIILLGAAHIIDLFV